MNAREVALNIIYQVNEEGAYANLALDKALSLYRNLDPRDKGLITELVYGSVRNRGRLDWMINKFAKPKVSKMDPWSRNIIRLGLYQLMFLDKIPASAAVNESVNLAKKHGHKGTASFVNGVLRNIQRGIDEVEYPHRGKQPVQYLMVTYSFPQWIIEKWVKEYGVKKAEEICQYFNEPAPLWIRTNTLKTSTEELQGLLSDRGISSMRSKKVDEGLVIHGEINLSALDLFQEGYFIVQDESSMLVSHAVNPQEGDRILDVCSAPGGKTTHMAQLLNNTGSILACDIHDHRLGLIQGNCDRLGIANVRTRIQDGEYIAEDLQETFDKVLVDAPCSGLGVLGRRADARWSKRASDIKELAWIQKNILEQASQLVRDGGTLVYSTCTMDKEENTEVVENFLADHPEFELDVHLADSWNNVEKGANGMAQFIPCDDDMDGFFIAKMIKRG